MAEKGQNYITGIEINTLEESLLLFDKPCLLEQLDISLEHIRRNKETKEKHLQLLKSVDKDLLKLSRTHHPDKAIGEKKLDEEVKVAQNLQTALNTTRTVLKALTEVFLNDIDVHYKYEFFAKLDINTLINEKQIDIEMNNVLCKISRLSEVKRVNIIGEIRKFLQESQECLRNFLRDSIRDFVRHRKYAFRHLHNCIEGYKMLGTECKLIVEECTDDNDENTKRAIQKIYEQGRKEYEFLLFLEGVVERSLYGNFEIVPTHRLKKTYRMEYVPVVPKEHEYFLLPFTFYVDVLLMCSVMVDTKTRCKKVITKLGELWNYFCGIDTMETSDIILEPKLLKEAYHLASFFNNKTHSKEVRMILLKKNYYPAESHIVKVFKEILVEIDQLLAEQFDINSYKEGKSNREQFNERLFKLNDSMAEFKEVEKDLLEKIKLYEKETSEIRKEYLEHIEKKEETEQECHENTLECESTRENSNGMAHGLHKITENRIFNQYEAQDTLNHDIVNEDCIETKSMNVIGEQEVLLDEHVKMVGDHEKNLLECPSSSTQNISRPMMHQHSSDNLEKTENRIINRNDVHENEIYVDAQEDHIETKSVKDIKELEKIPDENEKKLEDSEKNRQEPSLSCTQNGSISIVHQSSSGNQNGYSAVVEDTDKKNLKQEPPRISTSLEVSDEIRVTDKVQENIKTNSPSSENISGNETANKTAQMSDDEHHSFPHEHNEYAEGNSCSIGDQLLNESFGGQLTKRVSGEQIKKLRTDHQNCSRQNEGQKNNIDVNMTEKECEENLLVMDAIKNDWTIL